MMMISPPFTATTSVSLHLPLVNIVPGDRRIGFALVAFVDRAFNKILLV
jgi:hypothetical protein